MKRITFIFLAVFIFFIRNGYSHSSHATDVIQQVIKHYGSHKEKIAAVNYLAKSLSLHTMIVVDIEDELDKGIQYFDSCYYALAKGKSLEEMRSPDFKQGLNKLKADIDSVRKVFKALKPVANIGLAPDLITADQIIEHLDHAFFMRENVKCVRELNFEQFCQYFVPFENTPGYPIRKTNKYFSRFFSKYLPKIEQGNISEIVKFYHMTVDNFRFILGKYPFEQRLGFEELLFSGANDWECFDVSSFGAFSLNSCGLPTGIAYFCAFKSLNGIHSFNFIAPELGNYRSFSLEGSQYYPEEKDGQYQTDDKNLNVYRISYGHTEDSPVTLSKNQFDIPENLRNPLISDITGQFFRTGKLHVKLPQEHRDKIVYLCNFSSRSELVPVTWGKIQGSGEHLFEHVVPDRLYFLCLYDEAKGLSPIGNPIMVEMTDNKIVKKEFSGSDKKLNANLLRKYPLKKQTKARIESLVGTVVLASDHGDFRKGSVDTLYVVKHQLAPYLQDLDLNNKKPYKFYKILAPKERPNLYLSEVYFLSRKRNGYQNIAPAPGLPDLPANRTDEDLVWVLDGPLETTRKKAEYDGNVQTAPSAYPSVTLRLKEAQIIESVRVCPLNEDNGIAIGDIYTLFGWTEDQGWTHIETKEAAAHYLPFKEMSTNRLYWLKNETKGKEEMLFSIDDQGNQQFVFND